MKKGTRDILIIGGVGLAGYMLIQNRRAAAQPVPMAPIAPGVPGSSLGTAIGSFLNSIGSMFGVAGQTGASLLPTPGAPQPAPSSGGLFSWFTNLLPGASTPPPAPKPALAPVEGLGSLSGTVFHRRRR